MRPLSLAINTAESKEADTKLTRSELEELQDEIKHADRDKVVEIMKTLLKNQINEYHKTEINGIKAMAENEHYNFGQVKSAARGLLYKLVPSESNHRGGAKVPAEKFKFYSEQVHAVHANGKRQTRRNIVSVNGKKGTKVVETYDSTKKRPVKTKKSKALTAAEIANIRRGKFVPGLFKDCN